MKGTYETMIQLQTYKNEGLSNIAIAKRLGLHRETVAKYLRILEEARETGVKLESLFVKKTTRSRMIDPHMDYIRDRLLEFPELTAKRIYKEIRGMGYTGSMRTVRRYVAPLKSERPSRVYKLYETHMGEQAQVDWGHETLEVDGQKLKVYSFMFILSHARMRYVEYVTSLDSIVFLNCLHRAFEYIEGVPKSILFDNAKVVVSERVGRVIRFQSDFLQYATTMQFQPKACWVEDPESKGKVESTVGYVSRDFFYARKFSSLDDLNQKARKWCDEVNREVHETTKRIPAEVWEEERTHLIPLPEKKPLLFKVQTAKVNKACLLSFEGNRYSVPKEYARKTVRLEIYEQEFRMMVGNEELGEVEPDNREGETFSYRGTLQRQIYWT